MDYVTVMRNCSRCELGSQWYGFDERIADDMRYDPFNAISLLPWH